MANAFSKGNTGSNRGTSDKGSGAEGSPNGNSTTGAKHGSPGYGDYDLGGRGLKGELPIPQYDASNDEGTIVVSIYVNAQGKVTQAAATPSGSRGTAYANLTLRARAEAAARKAVFERKSSDGGGRDSSSDREGRLLIISDKIKSLSQFYIAVF